MSDSGRSTSFNASSISSQIDSYEHSNIVNARNYVKDLLKSRIFLGHYAERRLINQRIGYRDIVVVSAAEVELKRDLINALQSLRSVYSHDYWIGISDSDFMEYSSSVCLATVIENQPLGPFWFQIRSVKFRESEILVVLKCLRHITEAFLEVETILTSKTNKCAAAIKINADLTSNETTINILEPLKDALTVTNIKEFCTFIFAFIIAVFTGSMSFVNFIGNFILALVREVSILIKNSTPLFLGFLDFLSKIVGGLYILLAMFFKPNNTLHSNKRTIEYYGRPQQQFDDRNFD